MSEKDSGNDNSPSKRYKLGDPKGKDEEVVPMDEENWDNFGDGGGAVPMEEDNEDVQEILKIPFNTPKLVMVNIIVAILKDEEHEECLRYIALFRTLEKRGKDSYDSIVEWNRVKTISEILRSNYIWLPYYKRDFGVLFDEIYDTTQEEATMYNLFRLYLESISKNFDNEKAWMLAYELVKKNITFSHKEFGLFSVSGVGKLRDFSSVLSLQYIPMPNNPGHDVCYSRFISDDLVNSRGQIKLTKSDGYNPLNLGYLDQIKLLDGVHSEVARCTFRHNVFFAFQIKDKKDETLKLMIYEADLFKGTQVLSQRSKSELKRILKESDDDKILDIVRERDPIKKRGLLNEEQIKIIDNYAWSGIEVPSQYSGEFLNGQYISESIRGMNESILSNGNFNIMNASSRWLVLMNMGSPNQVLIFRRIINYLERNELILTYVLNLSLFDLIPRGEIRLPTTNFVSLFGEETLVFYDNYLQVNPLSTNPERPRIVKVLNINDIPNQESIVYDYTSYKGLLKDELYGIGIKKYWAKTGPQLITGRKYQVFLIPENISSTKGFAVFVYSKEKKKPVLLELVENHWVTSITPSAIELDGSFIIPAKEDLLISKKLENLTIENSNNEIKQNEKYDDDDEASSSYEDVWLDGKDNVILCETCAEKPSKVLCAGCLKASFCSKECLKYAWDITGHKKECKSNLIGAKKKGRPNKKGRRKKKKSPSKSKARKMLHEGRVHGKPLTDKQKKYFAYLSNKNKINK